MNCIKIVLIALCIFFCFVNNNCCAQGNIIEIDTIGVESNRDYIELYLKFLDEEQPVAINRLSNNYFKVTEEIEGEEPTSVTVRRIDTATLKRFFDDSKESISFYFLRENSKEVNNFVESNKLIKKLLFNFSNEGNFKFKVADFDRKVRNWKSISADNCDRILESSVSSENLPDLFRATFEAIRNEIRDETESNELAVLFLFSTGNYSSSSSVPIKVSQVKRQIDRFSGKDFLIFPIGIGENPKEDILSSFAEFTKSKKDRYYKNKIPPTNQILGKSEEYVYTHRLEVKPENGVFAGETRTYKVEMEGAFKGKETSKQITRGGTNIIFVKVFDDLLWAGYVVLGILLLAFLLILFIVLLPILRRRSFMKNFVSPFSTDGSVRVIDPLTQQPIPSGELVVKKCKHTISLDTWKDVGWQCPSYPNCMYHQNCPGSGAPEPDRNFFSMQGSHKKLNWLWFGSLGGFTGWLIFAGINFFGLNFHHKLIQGVFNSFNRIGGNFSATPNLIDLANDSILGIAFGAGIIFMLAWVEERGQSRAISWVRIIMRLILGIIFTCFIFPIGLYVGFNQLLPTEYIQPISWTLFGLTLGIVLSIGSSITLLRGLVGGAMSGIISYAVFFLCSHFIAEFNLGRLFGLLAMGGVLGWVLVSIVDSLEEYELEILSPSKFRQIFPISKWLKQNVDIDIGTASGSYVFVKWDDPEVKAKHAKMIYENNNVYLISFGETLVREKIQPTEKKVILQNGDIIRFGREGKTALKFIAKKSPKPGDESPKKKIQKKPIIKV